MRLVVASNPVADHRKRELLKNVAFICCQVQQAASQPVVVLPLLGGVVTRRVIEIIILVRDQEFLQLVKY
jgi:hypothetical protein